MNYYEAEDLERLAFEVRRFLGKGDYLTRICGMAKVYLEFPDIGSMYQARMDILRSMPPSMAAMGDKAIRRIDDGTIEIEVGGVSVILTCKKRFMTPSGIDAGYNQVNIVHMEMPELK